MEEYVQQCLHYNCKQKNNNGKQCFIFHKLAKSQGFIEKNIC